LNAEYELVQLANGLWSVRSLAEGETFHPVIGPVAEAEALYIRQLRVIERIRRAPAPFVVWDVGLGAAANVLTLLRNLDLEGAPYHLQIVSFDFSAAPLQFALEHREKLGYFKGYEELARALVENGWGQRAGPLRQIEWRLWAGDFPKKLLQLEAAHLPKPHAIFFDAYSPAKNPAMWTQAVFERIHRLLDPARPCALATYSRSTFIRVSLLLAGFFVGKGQATGEKDETTVAANRFDLVEKPLDRDWLDRARRSRSAEPLEGSVYRQQRLSTENWGRLLLHPQFAGKW
jgi:tRNA U34 5-methylaminomethyl-2-thiouridine-forming methyltransferase MnmC